MGCHLQLSKAFPHPQACIWMSLIITHWSFSPSCTLASLINSFFRLKGLEMCHAPSPTLYPCTFPQPIFSKDKRVFRCDMPLSIILPFPPFCISSSNSFDKDKRVFRCEMPSSIILLTSRMADVLQEYELRKGKIIAKGQYEG